MKDHSPFDEGKTGYGKLVPDYGKNPANRLPATDVNLAVVFSRHRFYRHLVVELVSAGRTQSGKLKNPLLSLDPIDRVWTTTDQKELKFYSGLTLFKNNYHDGKTESDLQALKAIVANPLQLPFFTHDEKKSATFNAGSLKPAGFSVLEIDLELNVAKRDDHYTISGRLHLGGKSYALERIELQYQYFIMLEQQFYLIDDPYFLSVIDFFKQHQNNLVIAAEIYERFQADVLAKMEEKIRINYSYLKKATGKQLTEQGFDLPNEQLIYLSESEDFVLITPVMKYGNIEIPVVSQKQIRSKDKRGRLFYLHRDAEKELQFITDIAKMHPYFEEQAAEFPHQRHADCFYLHRKHFLDPSWFLEAMEAWRSKGIAVLGFNELKGNKFNPYKAEISIKVISGIDWFETAIQVRFNKQNVSLKHLHRSIRDKSRFVQLGDGSVGILPDEWLEKFAAYFSAGEIDQEVIRTPAINFATVHELYEAEYLTLPARTKISLMQDQLSAFENIDPVPASAELLTSLRPYQQEGLNWLCFLDSFNFGACLADDMGLGKTIQVLAFLLVQRQRRGKNTNLVVVPASLVFNWQREIKKIAPSLTVMVVQGGERQSVMGRFDTCEVILLSYGTMLSAISWLKDYHFNYVILDESQAIKNPDSQRYKAARLLRSRNRIVITGTPVENSTFDLYGQLSFACPGLLGSREEFKRLYSVPIDQFKDRRREAELQKKINPFILRRTKAQVARDLPEKTEMVIYCEMGKKQREIYESCRDEIRDYLMGTAEDELVKSSMHVLQGITRLRQICNSPATLGDEKYYGNASAKIEVLMEQLETRAPFHKILVFSQFVGMLDLIAEELQVRKINFAMLTGQTRNREAVVNSFQNDPEVRVFLVSLKAGGVGLNLTAASYIYLIDPWWNPAVENQAIDRAYRIGQHQHVMAVRLICPDTIEEKIMGMQETKKDLATGLIKTDESIFKSLTKKELLELL